MKTVRIVLVDDTPLVLKTVQHLLSRKPGIEVVGASSNGADALEIVRRMKPDLAIVDLNMPGMNGIETAREIKRRPDAPRVVIFSFEEAAEWRRSAEEAGVDAWCDKRDPTSDLVNTIRRLFPDTDQATANGT